MRLRIHWSNLMSNWQDKMIGMFKMFNEKVSELRDTIDEEESKPPGMSVIIVNCEYCDAPNTHIETTINGVKSIRPISVCCDSCGGQFDD
jgi:hypothetical protein